MSPRNKRRRGKGHSRLYCELAQRRTAQIPHVRATARGAEQNHFIRFGLASLHAGRADRHSWYRKSIGARALRQELLKRARGNVSLDYVTRDFRGVTRCEVVRHAQPFLHGVEVSAVNDLGLEASFLQVLHPAAAAATCGIAVDRDDGLFGRKPGTGWEHGGGPRGQHESTCQLRMNSHWRT